MDFRHAGTVCVTVWRLKKGEYRLSTIEPYTGMYIKVAAVGGNVKVSRLGMNYFGADEPKKEYAGDDPVLKEIFDAAVASYRQEHLYDLHGLPFPGTGGVALRQLFHLPGRSGR